MQTKRTLSLLAALILVTTLTQAQSRLPRPAATPARGTEASSKLPEFTMSPSEVEAHTRFLASDELQGRRTGEVGNAVAARYIAEQFRLLGLKPASEGDFLQRINLEKVKAASSAMMTVGTDTLRFGKEVVVMAGDPADLSGEVIYVGYGLTDGEDGYKGKDVKGRIVVAQGGSPEAKGPGEIFRASNEKRKRAAEKGAAALIELYSESIPWGFVNQYFNREQIAIPVTAGGANSVAHVWVNNANNKYKQLKDAGQTVTLRSSGRVRTQTPSANVAGIIEGTDPKLKDEYVILSAHFDHIGMGKQANTPYQPEDSIFNGTRDNAMGTVAIMEAAKALSQQKPKRSILVLALTGEEVGLLGSRYYAEHPLVPLKQTIFDLNIDGAGYNDTTIVSVIGLERTGAKTEIETAAKAFGLGVFAEPAPEQGLFDRSDNVSFAAKGVPAPTFSPGFKTFDAAIGKYYHQAIDNPESLDYPYFTRFCQAYTYAARLIANRATRPQWSAEDKYAPAAKALYGQ